MWHFLDKNPDDLPPKDTVVNVLIKKIIGGTLRDNYYTVKTSTLINTMDFSGYFDGLRDEHGIVVAWQEIELPFEKYTTSRYGIYVNDQI